MLSSLAKSMAHLKKSNSSVPGQSIDSLSAFVNNFIGRHCNIMKNVQYMIISHVDVRFWRAFEQFFLDWSVNADKCPKFQYFFDEGYSARAGF